MVDIDKNIILWIGEEMRTIVDSRVRAKLAAYRIKTVDCKKTPGALLHVSLSATEPYNGIRSWKVNASAYGFSENDFLGYVKIWEDETFGFNNYVGTQAREVFLSELNVSLEQFAADWAKANP